MHDLAICSIAVAATLLNVHGSTIAIFPEKLDIPYKSYHNEYA
jgi:predicted Rossmann fold nucleotide-binding protein DprA/Smf involved in DNA uptake